MASVAMRQPLWYRMSWGSLFAGLFFGFGAWFVLLALGAGIGFASFNGSSASSWQGFGVGIGIWSVIAGIIAFFLGAWLAARSSPGESRASGMLHGAALWGFMMMIGLWIATMAVTGAASAAASAVGGAAQTAAQTAGQAAAQNPQLQRQAQGQAQQLQQQAQGLEQRAGQQAGQVGQAAQSAGTAGAWAFFVFGVLTFVAALLGGAAGIPKERKLIREEPAPIPDRPLSPQRA